MVNSNSLGMAGIYSLHTCMYVSIYVQWDGWMDGWMCSYIYVTFKVF